MFNRVCRLATIACVAVLPACEMTSLPSIEVPTIGEPLDSRPEGRRYVDHLLTDGGLQQIKAYLGDRAADVAGGRSKAFVSGMRLDRYNAPVLTGARVQRELSRLSSCLIRAWGGPEPDVRIRISSGLSPDAQALPNEVTVNLGLIAGDNIRAGEVAFVLAHELSHVFLDHYQRQEVLEKQAELLGRVAEIAILAAYASEVRAKRQGTRLVFFIEDKGDIVEAAITTLIAYGASQIVADGVVESIWGRDQELEADRLGLDVVLNAGIKPQQDRVFDRIETFRKNSKTRLERLEKKAEKQMNEALASGNVSVVARAGMEVFSRAVITAAMDLYDFLDRSHPSISSRRSEIASYRRELRDSGQGNIEPTTTCSLSRLERALKSRAIARTHKALKETQKVDDLLLEGKINEARAAAQRGLAGPGLNKHPVTRLAAYKVEFNAGNGSKALQHLERIRRSEATPLAVYTYIAGEYLSRGRIQEATRAVAQGERYYFEDNFYPVRLQLAYAKRDTEAFEAISASCRASLVPNIPEACDNIRKNRDPDAKTGAEGVIQGVGDLFERLSGT